MADTLQVLIVDDDPSISEVLSTFLNERGYAVRACGNAHEALGMLRDSAFDLVISDGQMAGMDGFEFVRLVRANYPDIAIILMTAYESEYPMSEALLAGADGYISKPFSLRKFGLVFEEEYWSALGRDDWWSAHKEVLGP